MKTKSGLLAMLAACAGLALLSPSPANAQWERFYFKADAGGNWTLDTDLKEFLGPVSPGTKVKFDPGARFGAAFGFHVTDWFAAEAETGVFANSIDTVTGATRVDAGFANVPFLLNARFQCPRMYRITPYFGGGIGGSAAVLDVDELEINGTRLHGNDSTAVFAYQAFGGLRCRLNDHMGLSVEYRYFATTDPEWRADVTFGTPSDKIRFGGTQTHAVSIAFDFRF